MSRGPGSKRRVAPRIEELYPEDYRLYSKPYLDTAAVLLSKDPADEEVVNEMREEIANLFEVIRYRTEGDGDDFALFDLATLSFAPLGRPAAIRTRADRVMDARILPIPESSGPSRRGGC